MPTACSNDLRMRVVHRREAEPGLREVRVCGSGKGRRLPQVRP